MQAHSLISHNEAKHFSFTQTESFLQQQLNILDKDQTLQSTDSQLLRDIKTTLSKLSNAKNQADFKLAPFQMNQKVDEIAKSVWQESKGSQVLFLKDWLTRLATHLKYHPTEMKSNLIHACAIQLHQHSSQWAKEYNCDWEKAYEATLAKEAIESIKQEAEKYAKDHPQLTLTYRDAEKFLISMTSLPSQTFFKSDLDNNPIFVFEAKLNLENWYRKQSEPSKKSIADAKAALPEKLVPSIDLLKTPQTLLDVIPQGDFDQRIFCILYFMKTLRDAKFSSILFPYFREAMACAMYLSPLREIAEQHGSWSEAMIMTKVLQRRNEIRAEALKNANPFESFAIIGGLILAYQYATRGELSPALSIGTAIMCAFAYFYNRFRSSDEKKPAENTPRLNR